MKIINLLFTTGIISLATGCITWNVNTRAVDNVKPENEYQILGRFSKNVTVKRSFFLNPIKRYTVESKAGHPEKYKPKLFNVQFNGSLKVTRAFEKYALAEVLSQNKKADLVLYPMFFSKCSKKTCEVNVRGYYASINKIKGDVYCELIKNPFKKKIEGCL